MGAIKIFCKTSLIRAFHLGPAVRDGEKPVVRDGEKIDGAALEKLVKVVVELVKAF
ncbi:MAG TPA: hypothetical protein VJ810_25555 [Blastocatellia bacterium]|nr:hypothetical protein [Blastocatellia bacterium]